jgi:hypothetical protein
VERVYSLFLGNALGEFNYESVRIRSCRSKSQAPRLTKDERAGRKNYEEAFDLRLLTPEHDRQEQQVKDPIEDERWCRQLRSGR